MLQEWFLIGCGVPEGVGVIWHIEVGIGVEGHGGVHIRQEVLRVIVAEWKHRSL